MLSSLSKAAPIVSEDLEREMSREIEVEFEEHLRDEEHGLDFDDDNEEDDGEEVDDDLFIQYQASESPCPNRVTQDDRGRYIRCGDSTSSTGRKKTKIDLSWRLKGAVLGGPSHFNVLRSFCGHVAFSSWSNPGNLRSWIKCYERPRCLEQMNEIKLSDTMSQRVSEIGLGHLSRCLTTNLDENLVSAFVERKVFVNGPDEEEDGEGSSTREDECLKTRVATFLAVDIDDVVPPIYKGSGLLTQKLRTVVESGNEHDSLRAYLMMLLGQTLFVDKSGDRVIARMLCFFEDLSAVSDYAWGATTLAYLYRELGMVTREGAQGVSGCLSLLQAWIYEFLDVVEPYQRDCCLRQFGYCQTIPMHMITPATDHRPANFPKSGYRVNFGQYADDQWGFIDARIKLSERSRPAVMPFETVPRYKIRFERIFHPYLNPPTHRVEFARIGLIWEELEVAR
ncbi:hypothetical protein RND81_06G108600 [Saponaria officinalis]|uniref:Aminotransferase-like plant mobile domain-containing protein n=1 Tax=Saponaria officinalis TaxID=3572 RepID=A0AAW1K5A8_SAPOF